MRLSATWTVLGLVLGVAAAKSNLTTPQSSQQILQSDFKPPQVFENTNLVRNVNLDKGYVRETINVQVTNVDKKAQSEYYVPFAYDLIGKIGGFDVRDKKSANKDAFEVSTAALTAVTGQDGSSSKPAQYYIVKFPQPLAPKAQITLSISYYILGALTPLPASIKQDQKQFLTYTFSAYVPSAYATLKQKTKVKFFNTNVPEYTSTTGLTKSKDPEVQGSSFTYGPYSDKVPAGAVYPVTVRYDFTNPVTVASLLERDVEVSLWGGNVATEERYWLRNDGATLIDHFSRVTWATQNFYHQTASSALKELNVPLKAGSLDPYFIDDIGNVSTSKFRPNTIREANLSLKPRYPVFGGWKYSFRIGWNNALNTVLRKVKASSNTYLLSVPVMEGPKQSEGIQYEKFVLRVVLPEGARNIKWETYGGTNIPTFQEEESLHKTFMDTVGRSTLKLSTRNVVDELREVTLLVSFEYPFLAAFRKPLSVFAGTVSVFTVTWLLSRLDTSIGKKQK